MARNILAAANNQQQKYYIEEKFGFLPDAIKDRRYYEPGDNKNELAFAQYWKKIKGE